MNKCTKILTSVNELFLSSNLITKGSVVTSLTSLTSCLRDLKTKRAGELVVSFPNAIIKQKENGETGSIPRERPSGAFDSADSVG